MDTKSIPRYYGFRIYLSSSILYFFLVIPFLTFLVFQSVPEFMKERPTKFQEAKVLTDSLGMIHDSITDYSEMDIDSLVNQAVSQVVNMADSMDIANGEVEAEIEGEEQENVAVGPGNSGPFGIYFLLLFLLTLLCYLTGLIYNSRFKRYFRLKRKNWEVPEKLHAFCKKQLFYTPVVNALILSIPNIAIITYSLIAIITRAGFDGEADRDLFIQLFYLSLVAATLEFLFVFYWQKHRVHIKYLDYIFSPEELRIQVFRKQGGKIRNRFLVASGMTTFLPLMIVTVYLILSLTSLKSLDLKSMTPEQKEVLIGPWGEIFDSKKDSVVNDKYQNLFYVNAIDSIVMLVGIGSGIVVSLIYILLFISWTNKDISVPLKELLANIRDTRGGEPEHFTVVRTNDEIGELAVGYNEMTEKIHDYVESISRMNRDLEETVKKRTNEVVEQKEEIEAQKEEIEAQLDLATLQRDTITRQKDQILDSIRYAERIQSAILPPIEHLSETFTDHFILFKPRDIVSGDYYWTTRKKDKIMIAVADCTGHGVPGAFLSMLGISSMNEIINRSDSISANRILEQLRDFVIASLHQTGSRGETQDGIEIALCVIDTRKMILEYAGANRPMYMIRRKKKDAKTAVTKKRKQERKIFEENSDHELLHIRADRMPIGIYDQDPIPFTNHKFPLERGDSIYLFSDGYVDQLGGPSRKTFRSRHFRNLLLDIQEHPMEKQMQILEEKLKSWSGDVEQIDDILVMGIKI